MGRRFDAEMPRRGTGYSRLEAERKRRRRRRRKRTHNGGDGDTAAGSNWDYRRLNVDRQRSAAEKKKEK
jgi:hypothetical protein